MCSAPLVSLPPTSGRCAQEVFPHREESVAAARDWTGRRLADWGLPEALREDARVCVSEAATNVLLHTEKSDLTLCLDFNEAEASLRIHVGDAEPARSPAPRNPSPESPGGRGLLLIEHLAREWGVTYADTDKTITCTFDTHPNPRPDHIDSRA
jgi:anti-sigma regulatory factor (Ser/Thr protein kinase)